MKTLARGSETYSPTSHKTSHKNFEYIKTAKCLKSHQAWWTVSYTWENQGERTAKRTHSHVPIHQAPPKTTLPPSIQLAPIRWDIMEDIQQVLQSENLLLSVLPASNMYPPTFFTKSKLVQGSFWWLSLANTRHSKLQKPAQSMHNPNPATNSQPVCRNLCPFLNARRSHISIDFYHVSLMF